MRDERKIIDKIIAEFSQKTPSLIKGIGDDCAVFKPTQGFNQVITTDTFCADVHFPTSCSTWQQVGYRNASSAISDIAAMGAIPRYYFSSLHFPYSFSSKNLMDYFKGVTDVMNVHKTVISGGNIIRYDGVPQFTLTITGEIEEEKGLYRNRAQTGDVIYMTQCSGNASAGLKILQQKKKKFPNTIYSKNESSLIESFFYPPVHIGLGRFLVEQNLSCCGIDCSDGFLSDLGKICQASKAGAILEEDKLPLSQELKDFCLENNISPLEQFLFGGDDYNLIFTIANKNSTQLPEKIAGITVTKIGKIIEGNKIYLKGRKTKSYSIPIKGYEH
ncbi:MAG: thiamine-phosphate kinase [Nitrospinae bacterium]|nr:thiamine-phosphate kinase [Nitrospinota bacterium]